MKLVLILIVAVIIWFLYRKFFPGGMGGSADTADFSEASDTTDTSPGGEPASSSGGSAGSEGDHHDVSAADSAHAAANAANQSATTSDAASDIKSESPSGVQSGTNDGSMYQSDELADLDATAIFEQYASGNPLTDIPELMRVLNLRASDAPRLGISDADFDSLKAGQPGSLSEDSVQDVLKKLTGML